MPSAGPTIFCCRIADVDSALLNRCRILLDAQEQQRSSEFRSNPARTAFIISRALLRTKLAELLHCRTDELQFIRNDDGKPLLAAPATDWHFNLSHSHEWVILALSRLGPVGVDVESHERSNDLTAIARRFFRPQENQRLAMLKDEQWLQQFFAIWTLKEAHGKALGTGLSKILSCCAIDVNLHNGAIAWNLAGAALSRQAIFSALYRLEAGISLALVQLFDGETPAPIAMRCVPLCGAGEFVLAPIARGDWRPTA